MTQKDNRTLSNCRTVESTRPPSDQIATATRLPLLEAIHRAHDKTEYNDLKILRKPHDLTTFL